MKKAIVLGLLMMSTACSRNGTPSETDEEQLLAPYDAEAPRAAPGHDAVADAGAGAKADADPPAAPDAAPPSAGPPASGSSSGSSGGGACETSISCTDNDCTCGSGPNAGKHCSASIATGPTSCSGVCTFCP